MRNDIDKFIIDFADIPYDRVSIERILTGYHDLDYDIKGIETGLTALIGDTNVGKSILTSRFLDCSIKQGYKAGVFASEHSLRKYKMLLMQQNARAGEFELVPFIDKSGLYDGSTDTNIADWYVNKAKEQEVSKRYNNNLFLFDTRRVERDVDTICDFMERCYEKFGIRFFILDNFMEIENNKNNEFQEQTNIITKLRNTAIRLNLFVVLVMHISKDAVREGFRLNIKSASGTSNSGNKAYNVIALYRKDCIITTSKQDKMLDKFKQDCAKNGFDYEKCDSFLEVLKTKGNRNGIVGLKYLDDSKTLEQAAKVSKTDADKLYKKYETKPTQTSLDFDTTKNELTPIEDNSLDDIFGDDALPF